MSSVSDYYTSLTKDNFIDILSFYDIGHPIQWKNLYGGLANTNYELHTTCGVYLLKLSEEKSLDQIKAQIDVLNYIKPYHFPTAYPIALKKFSWLYKSRFIYSSKKNYYLRFLEGNLT